MNYLPNDILKKANEAAIYSLYLYLAQIAVPAENAPLHTVITDLKTSLRTQKTYTLKSRDIYRLKILSNAVSRDGMLANSKISNLTVQPSGLTACSFTNQNGNVFVAFRGTGKGEWIDNGEGLSGVAEENTYKAYGNNGITVLRKTVIEDYATDQQAEALNWFNRIAAKNGWGVNTKITVCGHSKGGNKAQFVAISSNLADDCYSFDGQGFSPEALQAFKSRYGGEFETRRKNIYSFATDNDYVNVLGERLMPQNQIYFFKSRMGIHYLEAMLNTDGGFNSQCEQGELSRYVEAISKRLMVMKPQFRKYATLGVMNIFQRFLGEGRPVNGDKVSIEQTVVGMGIAIELLMRQFYESADN